MTPIDYIVIAAYLVFILALGPVYRRFSHTASDYFRGGGGMLWWMVGASAWVMTFSAWTFTGGAGKAYETGTFFLVLGVANLVGLIFTYFFTAAKFRQMRIITPVEAIRKRFGPANEQFFTWLPVPFGIIFGGIGLYAIGIFMTVVFGVPLWGVIVGLGLTVTLMSMSGGSWAVVASDFVQMLTILVITLVMAVLALAQPRVGGLSGLIEKSPAAYFDWTRFDRPGILIIFAVGLLVSQLIQPNSINEGARKFIYCKSGRDAKKALLISIIGTAIITPIFIIPAMAAHIVHPNLAAEFSNLNNPSEAAYVAMAMTVLPKGMLGLLVCGIFAATMSSMDTGLNVSSGIIVRNFYLPVVNPEASEAGQIKLGKLVTVVLGLSQIVVGLVFSQFRSIPLFDLILLVAALVGMPVAVPLFFGIFIKRTPPWAGWSTVVVGFCVGLALKFVFTSDVQQQFWHGLFGGGVFNGSEAADLNVSLTTLSVFVVCLVWFLCTIPFWKGASAAYHARVEAFFEEMHTPIDPAAEGVAGWEEDKRQYRVIGVLCLCYGGFILLLAALPNPLWGRACFVFCGGVIAGLGAVLYFIARRMTGPAEATGQAGEPASSRVLVGSGSNG